MGGLQNGVMWANGKIPYIIDSDFSKYFHSKHDFSAGLVRVGESNVVPKN